MSKFDTDLAALDDSISDWIGQEQFQEQIDARTRSLFGADGSTYGYSREEAREQARVDVMAEVAANDSDA